jgi:hypothetical protein
MLRRGNLHVTAAATAREDRQRKAEGSDRSQAKTIGVVKVHGSNLRFNAASRLKSAGTRAVSGEPRA